MKSGNRSVPIPVLSHFLESKHVYAAENSDGPMGTPLLRSTIVLCRQPMIKICSAKLQTSMGALLPEKDGKNPDEKQQKS